MIWNVSLEKRLVELATSEEKHSSYKIASILSDEFGLKITRDSVKNKLGRVNFEQLVSKPKTSIMPYFDKYRDYYLGDKEELPKINTIIDKYPFRLIDKRDLKILHLCDLHVPFENNKYIQLAVNRHNTSDMVVISEFTDCYAISRFNKSFSIPLEIEIDNTVRLYEYFSQTFPLVIILETNHDIRVEKSFLRSVPESLLFLAETHMLRKLAKPFNNIIVIPNWYFQINDCLITHAETTSKVDTKAGINVYNFFTEWRETLELSPIRLYCQDHCFSEDTEILTKEGWKSYADLSCGDEVLTLNREKDLLEYNIINNIVTYDNFKELIEIGNGLLVTPEHRIIYKSTEDGVYKECKALEFNNKILYCAGRYEGAEVPYSDDFIRFVGLFISEGGFASSGIRIYQDWSNKQWIEELLDNLGYRYTLYKKDMKGRRCDKYFSKNDEAIFYINSDDAKQLKSLLSDKNIPDEFMNMNKRQFTVLLEYLMRGDGTFYPNHNGGQYFTANKNLADRLQELCIKHGLRTSLRSRIRGLSKKEGYVLTWLDTPTIHIQKPPIKVSYDGSVWCVSVANGTVIVRRPNSRPFIVGNTHMLSSTYRAGGRVKVIESGCMCNVLEYPIDKLYSKPQVNGFVTILQRNGITDLALSREHFLSSLTFTENSEFLGVRR